MTTAASEEISEACGHPEMELVDMVPDASTAALWSASSADMGTWTVSYTHLDVYKRQT